MVASCYFWSDTLNAFLFNQGPMSPTLLDITFFTNLNITTFFKPTHRLPTKSIGGWSKYIANYNKSSGPVDDREHTAFLNM